MQNLLRISGRALVGVVCAGIMALVACGAGCQTSTNVQDLQPAADQPPLEKLPEQN